MFNQKSEITVAQSKLVFTYFQTSAKLMRFVRMIGTRSSGQTSDARTILLDVTKTRMETLTLASNLI